ncbi:MAG: hypothetical protein ACLTEX_01400 [Eggerthella lenta]
MNLLPIPPLDGGTSWWKSSGHRKTVSQKAMN